MNEITKYKKEIVLALLIFLVTTLSFAAGYLLAERQGRAPIIIEKAIPN